MLIEDIRRQPFLSYFKCIKKIYCHQVIPRSVNEIRYINLDFYCPFVSVKIIETIHDPKNVHILSFLNMFRLGYYRSKFVFFIFYFTFFRPLIHLILQPHQQISKDKNINVKQLRCIPKIV